MDQIVIVPHARLRTQDAKANLFESASAAWLANRRSLHSGRDDNSVGGPGVVFLKRMEEHGALIASLMCY
jgi:hypothetical protein